MFCKFCQYIWKLSGKKCLYERWSLVGVASLTGLIAEYLCRVLMKGMRNRTDTLSAWINIVITRLASRPIRCKCLWQAYRSKQFFQGHLEKLLLFHHYAQKHFFFSLQNGEPGHKGSLGIIFIKIFFLKVTFCKYY